MWQYEVYSCIFLYEVSIIRAKFVFYETNRKRREGEKKAFWYLDMYFFFPGKKKESFKLSHKPRKSFIRVSDLRYKSYDGEVCLPKEYEFAWPRNTQPLVETGIAQSCCWALSFLIQLWLEVSTEKEINLSTNSKF